MADRVPRPARASPPTGARPTPHVTEAVAAIGALVPLLDLADGVPPTRRRRGLRRVLRPGRPRARRMPRRRPRGRRLRERFRVVLLDEYQDTRVVQTRLLARLFARHGGDGGRRSAPVDLRLPGRERREPRPVPPRLRRSTAGATPLTFALSTSWRNPVEVLDAANGSSRRSPRRPRSTSSGSRPGPAPRRHGRHGVPRDPAGGGRRGRRVVRRPTGAANPDGSRRSCCAPGRTCAAFAAASPPAACRSTSSASAVCCSARRSSTWSACLRVLHDPAAGSELIRLLPGPAGGSAPRHRGAADVARGCRATTTPSSGSTTRSPRRSGVGRRGRARVDRRRARLRRRGARRHGALAGFSDGGPRPAARARAAARLLRSRAGGDLVDFVTLVEQEMLLDIEVAANEQGTAALPGGVRRRARRLRRHRRPRRPRRLPLLARRGRAADDMGPRSEEPEAGTVQLLTVHGSKGLEWDVVAVPRLVEGELPAQPQRARTAGSASATAVRVPRRRRRAPGAGLARADDQKDVTSRRVFKDELKARNSPRSVDWPTSLSPVRGRPAADRVVLGGRRQADAAEPVPRDLAEAGVVDGAASRRPPVRGRTRSATPPRPRWPLDPLGDRARRGSRPPPTAVRTANPGAAGRNRPTSSCCSPSGGPPLGAAPGRRAAAHPRVAIQGLRRRPRRGRRALRRPMPERPYRATRLGTLFHAWVESAAGRRSARDPRLRPASSTSTPTRARRAVSSPRVSDDDARRLASSRRPSRVTLGRARAVEVELEIHLPLGRTSSARSTPSSSATAASRSSTGRPARRRATPTTSSAAAPARALPGGVRQFTGRSIDEVDAVFYFVADDLEVRPRELLRPRRARAGLVASPSADPTRRRRARRTRTGPPDRTDRAAGPTDVSRAGAPSPPAAPRPRRPPAPRSSTDSSGVVRRAAPRRPAGTSSRRRRRRPRCSSCACRAAATARIELVVDARALRELAVSAAAGRIVGSRRPSRRCRVGPSTQARSRAGSPTCRSCQPRIPVTASPATSNDSASSDAVDDGRLELPELLVAGGTSQRSSSAAGRSPVAAARSMTAPATAWPRRACAREPRVGDEAGGQRVDGGDRPADGRGEAGCSTIAPTSGARPRGSRRRWRGSRRWGPGRGTPARRTGAATRIPALSARRATRSADCWASARWFADADDPLLAAGAVRSAESKSPAPTEPCGRVPGRRVGDGSRRQRG